MQSWSQRHERLQVSEYRGNILNRLDNLYRGLRCKLHSGFDELSVLQVPKPRTTNKGRKIDGLMSDKSLDMCVKCVIIVSNDTQI